MKKTANNNLIVLAREAAGLTQVELADMIGLNQANVSRIENGFLNPSDDVLDKIAEALSFPKEFFFEHGTVFSPQVHFYRKAQALANKDFSRVRANAVIDRLRIEKLLNAVEIEKDYVSLELEEYGSAEEIAKELRRRWKIPRGPIKNLSQLLENRGIILFPIDCGTRFISDLTTQTEAGTQIIFLNDAMPPDRDRFTLSHALGHIVMHKLATSETIEQEADRFAGAFLMPSEDIKHQLVGLNIEKLADLKRQWKVSMGSILMRAMSLKMILPSQSGYLWKKISALGYKLSEPVEPSIEKESPTLVKDILALHKSALNYSENEIKKLLFLRDVDLDKYGFKRPSKLKLVHQKGLRHA